MPAYSTISKGLNEAQTAALQAAVDKSGLSRKQAIEEALKLFVESHGELWPMSQQHGGWRPVESELITLLDALMINQDGDQYARRPVPEEIDQRVVEYAVARGYCMAYHGNMAAPTEAGEMWLNQNQ